MMNDTLTSKAVEQYGLYIDGEYSPAEGGGTIESLDPRPRSRWRGSRRAPPWMWTAPRSARSVCSPAGLTRRRRAGAGYFVISPMGSGPGSMSWLGSRRWRTESRFGFRAPTSKGPPVTSSSTPARRTSSVERRFRSGPTTSPTRGESRSGLSPRSCLGTRRSTRRRGGSRRRSPPAIPSSPSRRS